MNKLNNNLVNQYKEAMGYKNINLKSKCFKQEYLEWLKERKKIGYRYLDFLYEMKQEIIERSTAEVEKSSDDSIIQPFDTTIISPYEYYDIEDKTRIIPARMMILDEEIVLQIPPKDQIRLMMLPRNLKLLMTQNPYSPYSIADWDALHNSENYDIAVGIYGSIYDKDIKEKLNMLKSLKEKILFGDYKYDLNHDGDIYYGALVSDRKEKILKK